ncbi:MAG: DUF3352 domain-containing protein [Bacteroidales bacterium]|nr:DUF3352 domain-containing protein [Bacteroidales bacterium]
MSGSGKITLNLVFAVIIIALISASYFFIRDFTMPTESPIKAVPQSSALFIEIKNPQEIINKISDTNNIWRDLCSISNLGELNKNLMFFDSLSLKNKNIRDILSNKIIISFHTSVENNIKVLLLIKLKNRHQSSAFRDIVENAYGHNAMIIHQKFKGNRINKIIRKNTDKIFAYTVKNGVFIGSFSISLIEQSLEQLSSEKAIDDDYLFRKVKHTAGKRINANLYINFSNFSKLASVFAKDNHRKNINLLKHFAKWSELDLMLKDNELLLNGYTVVSDSVPGYLQLFNDQLPQKIEIVNILPYNTTVIYDLGFEDFQTFFVKNKNYSKAYSTKLLRSLSKINRKYNIVIEKYMLSWIGNEVAMVSSAIHSNEFSDKSFAIIHSKNVSDAKNKLNALTKIIPGSSRNISYKNYKINKVNIPDLISVFFGTAFSRIENNYYTFIDNYVIFANSSSSLKDFINLYLSGKTLDLNENYQDFSDNISENSNLFFYYDFRNSHDLLKLFLKDEYFSEIKNNIDYLQNFQAFAFQFSSINKMFYTNIYLKNNPTYKEENRAVWKTTLNAEVTGKPYFVKDHTNNTYNIIVFDEENSMYLIDNNGNILWNIALDGKVISEVYEVDYYKNRKIQYVFNTENSIYLIDLKGRDVANYPKKLGTKATNGLVIFDYVKDKNYRMVFAGADKKVYNYSINGKAVKGWINPKSKSIVTGKIQHLIAGNSDYIIIPDVAGNVKITERRGKNRIIIRGDFVNAVNSDFYVNKTNSKGVLITTNQKGHLIYIKRNGQTSSTIFDDFSPEHYFLYEDFDMNGSKDFIFLDKNKLSVFDRFKSIVFEYTFDEDVHTKPIIIPVSSRENFLGIILKKKKEIYLFDNKGNVVVSSGVTGEMPFNVGSLNNDKNLNLVVGSGNILYNYLIQ